MRCQRLQQRAPTRLQWEGHKPAWQSEHLLRSSFYHDHGQTYPSRPLTTDNNGRWTHELHGSSITAFLQRVKCSSSSRRMNYIKCNPDLSHSYQQPRHCLLNRLFRHRSKLRVTSLWAEMASDMENVSIWWRHHLFAPNLVLTDGIEICICKFYVV